MHFMTMLKDVVAALTSVVPAQVLGYITYLIDEVEQEHKTTYANMLDLNKTLKKAYKERDKLTKECANLRINVDAGMESNRRSLNERDDLRIQKGHLEDVIDTLRSERDKLFNERERVQSAMRNNFDTLTSLVVNILTWEQHKTKEPVTQENIIELLVRLTDLEAEYFTGIGGVVADIEKVFNVKEQHTNV
jgi:chromosome segregation ATPase